LVAGHPIPGEVWGAVFTSLDRLADDFCAFCQADPVKAGHVFETVAGLFEDCSRWAPEVCTDAWVALGSRLVGEGQAVVGTAAIPIDGIENAVAGRIDLVEAA
jgi:hypothetical protein